LAVVQWSLAGETASARYAKRGTRRSSEERRRRIIFTCRYRAGYFCATEGATGELTIDAYIESQKRDENARRRMKNGTL
jgi:hypothetical protein